MKFFATGRFKREALVGRKEGAILHVSDCQS